MTRVTCPSCSLFAAANERIVLRNENNEGEDKNREHEQSIQKNRSMHIRLAVYGRVLFAFIHGSTIANRKEFQ